MSPQKHCSLPRIVLDRADRHPCRIDQCPYSAETSNPNTQMGVEAGEKK
jgi:hypothetical protein